MIFFKISDKKRLKMDLFLFDYWGYILIGLVFFFLFVIYFISPVRYTDCTIDKEERNWADGYSKNIYYEIWGIKFSRTIKISEEFQIKNKVIAGKYQKLVCYPVVFPFTALFDYELYDNPDKREKIMSRRTKIGIRDFSGTVYCNKGGLYSGGP